MQLDAQIVLLTVAGSRAQPTQSLHQHHTVLLLTRVIYSMYSYTNSSDYFVFFHPVDRSHNLYLIKPPKTESCPGKGLVPGHICMR